MTALSEGGIVAWFVILGLITTLIFGCAAAGCARALTGQNVLLSALISAFVGGIAVGAFLYMSWGPFSLIFAPIGSLLGAILGAAPQDKP